MGVTLTAHATRCARCWDDDNAKARRRSFIFNSILRWLQDRHQGRTLEAENRSHHYAHIGERADDAGASFGSAGALIHCFSCIYDWHVCVLPPCSATLLQRATVLFAANGRCDRRDRLARLQNLLRSERCIRRAMGDRWKRGWDDNRLILDDDDVEVLSNEVGRPSPAGEVSNALLKEDKVS